MWLDVASIHGNRADGLLLGKTAELPEQGRLADAARSVDEQDVKGQFRRLQGGGENGQLGRAANEVPVPRRIQ